MVHRHTDIFHIAISGDNNTLQCRVTHLVDLGQKCQAIHLGHIDIAQYNIKIRMRQNHVQGFYAIMSKRKLILSLADFPPEILCQQGFQILFVINTQYLNRHKPTLISYYI